MLITALVNTTKKMGKLDVDIEDFFFFFFWRMDIEELVIVPSLLIY